MKLPLQILTPLLLTASMLCSCGGDGELLPPADGDGMVSLVLDFGVNPGAPSASRAPSDETVNGVDFEPAANNYEKVKELRVIILRPSHNNEVEINSLITGETALESPDFFLPDVPTNQATIGRFTFQVVDQEWKKVYLIANESTLPEGIRTKLSDTYIKVGQQMPLDLDESLITVEPQAANGTAGYYIDNSDNSSYVPLTESFDLLVDCATKGNVSENTNGVTKTQSASFFVTRASTKFSFSASADVAPGSTFAITGITITGLSTAEYLIPRNTFYSPSKEQPGYGPDGGREILSFSAPASAEEYSYTFTPAADEPFAITGGTTGTKASSTSPGATPTATYVEAVYNPNLYFLESPVGKYRIIVNTKVDGQPYTWGADDAAPVYLPNLSLLPRNTHVRIHLSFTGRTLNATVTVFPYTAVNLNPEFGFSAPVTDRLTVAPEMVIPNLSTNGLLSATFTSTAGNTIDNLIWVSSDQEIVLLQPKDEDNDPDHTSQLYIRPAESIELPYGKEVKVVPQKAGTAYVTAYSQTGLVARCKVTVK